MMLPSLLFSRNLRGNPIEIGMLNTPVRSNTEKRDGIDDDTSINLTDFAAERDAFLSHLYKGPCTYDVRKISGIFDPLPPLVQFCPIFHNPLPLLDII